MGPQIVVAPDICLRLAAQRERLGRIDERPIVGFAINQAMEDIQHMCLRPKPVPQRSEQLARHGAGPMQGYRPSRGLHQDVAASVPAVA